MKGLEHGAPRLEAPGIGTTLERGYTWLADRRWKA